MVRDDNARDILELLETLLCRLKVEVRYESLFQKDGELNLTGGLCRLRGKSVVIVDRQLSPKKRCIVLIDALRQVDTSEIFVPPLIRQLLKD